jgi:serine/threonine protein kinase
MISQQTCSGDLHPSMLFRDRYFILYKVGAGGFGSVYKARDTLCGDRLVAIKEVRLQGLPSQAMSEAAAAFQREVDVLSQLHHPNLPRIYEHFQIADQWYLIMEFIEGETLEAYQGRAPNRKLLLSEVLDIGIRLCRILDYLHSQQPPIIFRDLKPTNVIRASTGQLYLVDFGIARYFKPGQAKDTVALGSPGYAAPEQYGKAQTTPRADIYSLGALLHQLLTTSDPSESPFRFRPLRPQNYSDPGSLTTSMVDVLVDKLERLIVSMLSMDVNERPLDVASVKQELHEISALWADINKGFWRPKTGYKSSFSEGKSSAGSMPS